MHIKKYKRGKWVDETKEEVQARVDIEGKSPCDRCWKEARDNGIYVWPLLPAALRKAVRCPVCKRLIG